MEPTTRDASIADAITPPGSTLSRWQNHHGTPFCKLTTVVCSPIRGFNGGASWVRPCAFTPRKITSNVPASARSPISFGRTSKSAPGFECNTRSPRSLPSPANAPRAREQRHILAGTRHACADITADRSRPRDQKPHRLSSHELLRYRRSLRSLPGCRARNRLGDENFLLGAFEVRQPFLAERQNSGLARLVPDSFFEHDRRRHLFAPRGMWHAERHRFRHRRMLPTGTSSIPRAARSSRPRD